MRKSVSLVLTWGILCSSLSSVYSRVPQSLIDEIAREYQTFRGQSIKGLTQQPCRAIQFVYDLQQRFRQNKDQHIADMITAVVSEGAGVGGIDTSRQANDTERMIAYSALYEAIDNKADVPTLTLEDSSRPTLKKHQKVVHSIYLAKRDSKLSLKSSDFLRDDSSYRTLTQSSQEHSEQYIKNMFFLERYLNKTKILKQFVGQEREQLTQTLRKSLTKYIVENNNKWIDPQDLKVAEQFFWNLYEESFKLELKHSLIELLFSVKAKLSWREFLNFPEQYSDFLDKFDILSIYQTFPEEIQRSDFLNFCRPYLKERYREENRKTVRNLLSIFQAFPKEDLRRDFFKFCEHDLGEPVSNPSHMGDFLLVYQAFPEERKRQDFFSFCKKYIDIVRESYKLKDLLSIYQDFPEEGKRQDFLKFCNSYQGPKEGFNTVKHLYHLLPIYQALPDESKRQDFFNFWKSIVGTIKAIGSDNFSDESHVFLKFYQSFDTEIERQSAYKFSQPYLQTIYYSDKRITELPKMLLVCQAFPQQKDRDAFLEFCNPFFPQRKTGSNLPYILENLLVVYQTFPEEKSRQEFLTFCNPYLEAGYQDRRDSVLKLLVNIYLEQYQEDFSKFSSSLILDKSRIDKLIHSYYSRDYLRYMRVQSALKAEENPQGSRIESMYNETKLTHQLPAYNADDQFIHRARGNDTVANAHEFDAIYELDREFLWKETAGYQGKKGTKSLTIYNNQNKQDNYHTNKEVEDFIQYLDEEVVKMEGKVGSSNLAPVKALDVVKQMLGLAKKGEGTTGGFAPYLGHSMYYAKPDSPQGDEVLGRVWFLIKTKAKEKKDEDLKKAVVVAILEAAEVSTSQVDTHCQTRMTGELMKLVSYQFPKQSKLYPLIAAADLPEVQTEDDIQNRIINAPVHAQQLFKRLKKEYSGNIRKVIENHLEDGTDPELWERYEAYYDDLYRRTKNEDGKGYKLDENILKRDEHGNLVSFYQANGSKRETPQIVYYQAEFQVFEKAFTDLMRQEFEEQRGLKY